MPPARAVAPLEPPAISAEVALLSRGSSSNATASTGAACISLVAYENVVWIDALLDNALTLTGARIALHLNSQSEYDAFDLDRWAAMERVVLSQERVAVSRNTGSILYAHLINARTLNASFPTTCTEIVFQASNMAWVRPGMDAEVTRRHSFLTDDAALANVSAASCSALYAGRVGANQICSAALSSPVVRHLSRKRGLWTWKAHEGSFYPLAWVLSFGAVLDSWAQANRFNVLEATPMPEEFWLPIWVLNEKAVPAEASGPQVAMRGPEDCDYCISRDVVDGLRQNGGPYYGVKRVERDLSNEVTQYVFSLALRERLRPSRYSREL